jgi:catechol 2,3-dioxygenase-like lactoylglutathione lyase family enzyme
MVMDRPTHAGLRHLALNVERMAEMRHFYIDLLGFTVEWEPDPDNIYLTSGIDNLALHRSTRPSHSAAADHPTGESSAAAATTEPASRLDHLGVIVRQPEDVDRWASYLGQHGVTIAAKPKTHRDGARSCYVTDPDGNHVQIIHHPPISGKV